MKQWKCTLDISDLHAKSRAGELTADELGKQVAARIRGLPSLRYREELEDIAQAFADYLAGFDEYDGVLAELYDWADEDKRLWVNTFSSTKSEATP